MPAECEVGACGVLAVGRCATCNSAFCATHQARSPGTRYVDYCSSCLAQEKAAEGSRHRVWQAANDPSLLAAMVEVMLEAKIGGLEDRRFRWETTALEQRGSWGKPRVQRVTHEFVGDQAWPVGWLPLAELDRQTRNYVTVERPCGVTTSGTVVLMPEALSAAKMPQLFSWVEYGERDADLLDSDLLSLSKDDLLTEPGKDAVAIAARGLNALASRRGLNLAQQMGWSEQLAAALCGNPDQADKSPAPAAEATTSTRRAHQPPPNAPSTKSESPQVSEATRTPTRRQLRRAAVIRYKQQELHAKMAKINTLLRMAHWEPGTPKSRRTLKLERQHDELHRKFDELGRQHVELTGRGGL